VGPRRNTLDHKVVTRFLEQRGNNWQLTVQGTSEVLLSIESTCFKSAGRQVDVLGVQIIAEGPVLFDTVFATETAFTD
jgi:hypothetical protein